MNQSTLFLLLTSLVFFLFACGTQSKTPDTDIGLGNSPEGQTDRYIIFLNQEYFPSFTQATQQTQFGDREEQGRAAEAYEAEMGEKIREFAVKTLGLASDQIVNVMTGGFSAIVANLTPAQVAEVEQWPSRFEEVGEVQRDFEVHLDPGEVIIVDPDTLKQ
jgi:hypothetical protein